VYILKDGCIVDKGTFDELRKYSLVFQEIWHHQDTQKTGDQVPSAVSIGPNIVLPEVKRA
jgi:hypothetical protein